MLSGETPRVPSVPPAEPDPQPAPLCSPLIAALAGKLALTGEDAVAVAPNDASATVVGQTAGQVDVAVRECEKSTRVLTRAPLPGPTGPGSFEAPQKLDCALTVAGPSF